VVIRVDKDKGYIDLSKRRVYSKDLIQCEERFAKAKAVNSILRHVADILEYTTDRQFEELYEKTAWYFDDKNKKQGASYDVFKLAVNDSTVLDECDLDGPTKETLLTHIKRRLMPQAVKVRADVEVGCCTYDGIDAVKTALRLGIACSTPENQIKVNLIAPPLYVITTQTMDREEGLRLLNVALEKIQESIKGAGGIFNIQQAAKVVTDLDDEELAKKLNQLELENQEVSGDDDDEEVIGNGNGEVSDAEEAEEAKVEA